MSNDSNLAPVITIDGPSGSGKGTISQLLAQNLNWHLLDSGSLYRILGVLNKKNPLPLNDEKLLKEQVAKLNLEFLPNKQGEPALIILNGKDISSEIRTESAGQQASIVAANPIVRAALIDWQRNFRKHPGLIADGRDMGTTIFPDAKLKLYLTATTEERAKRRYKQLLAAGIDVKLADLIHEVAKRDARDIGRKHSPLKPAEDAIIIDTSNLPIETVMQQVIDKVFSIFEPI